MTSRLRIDLFTFALGALALLAVLFFEARNGAAVAMCVLCFAGLMAARLAGFSNRALVPLTIGLVAILWMVWIDPPSTSRRTSALAHGLGGVLVGWALADYLRARISWPGWGLVALTAVLAVTVLWELGELFVDSAFDTSLRPNAADSVEDILLGALGGSGAVAAAWLLAPRRTRD